MTRIFVTADDAGMCRDVDEAVSVLARARRIDCMSIMAAGPGAAAAVSLSHEHGIAVSVHLNCVEPPFLTDSALPGMAGLCLRTARWLPAVEAEWRSQIEMLLSMGALVTGLDSHRHVHHLPGLDDLVLRLASEYGAGVVRVAVLPDRLGRLSGVLLDHLARRLKRKAGAAGIRTREAMAGFAVSGRVTSRYLEGLDLPDGEVELVMHPAVRPVWSEGQPAELELLMSDWFGRWSGRVS